MINKVNVSTGIFYMTSPILSHVCSVENNLRGKFKTLENLNIKEWRISLWWLVPHVSKSHTWMPLPHVSKSHTWMSPPHVSKSHTWMSLHHWGNATREGITVHVSHTWAVREGLLSTIEEMLHVRALPCMWATRELYVRGSSPPLRKCYTWGHYRACEPHVNVPSTRESRTAHVHGNSCVGAPHMWMSLSQMSPLHTWVTYSSRTR